MSESRESSIESRLASFQDKIKSFVEKRRLHDGTIVHIVNVKELGVEEKELWDAYGQLLKEATKENADYVVISKKTLDLGHESGARQIDANNKNRISASFFYNWLNNRIATLSMNTQYLTEKPKEIGEVLPELQGEFDEYFGS